MNRNTLFILFATLLTTLSVRADLLTDILHGTYKAKTMASMTEIPDKQQYALLQGDCIVAFDYRTAKVVDTLFNAATTRISQVDNIEGFLLSPVDRYLLVYNNSKQIFRHSFCADYYIFDRQRNELKPLTTQMPVREPVFSPNGKYIAFGRDNNIFIYKVDFGTEVAVTTDGAEGRIINGTTDWLYEEEFGITTTYTFSPDSKQLAFLRTDETEVAEFRWQEFLNDDDATAYPKDFSLRYPRAGTENAKVSVMVYDTYYKSVKKMQVDADYVPRLRWTHNSDQLAVFTLNRNQNKMEMWYANPKSTVSKLIYAEENRNGWVDYSAIDECKFLENGDILLINETSGFRQAYLYSALGQKKQQLTSVNQDVTAVYGIDEATMTLYYQVASTPMTRDLYSLNIKKNRTTKLSTGEGMHNAIFTSDYAYFIDNYSSVNHANSYVLYDRQGKQIRTILKNDEVEVAFAQLGLPQKEFFTITTERGDELNAWVLKPKNFDENKRYPVVQVQYSGPCSQQVLNRWRIDWEHYLSAEGYVVVCADGRGTGARGREWREQTYMTLGQKEAQDQVSVARYMQSLDYVDADRIALWGWSYGGFMTLRAMSEPESPFRCGIAVAPVTDFRLYDSAYTERYMRRPQANAKGYEQCALPLMADKLQGRVLIVHGLADDNVHCQNTWVYVNALIEAGVQFEMQIYPDDNHFLRKRSNYEHLYRRKMDFLEHNLQTK